MWTPNSESGLQIVVAGRNAPSHHNPIWVPSARNCGTGLAHWARVLHDGPFLVPMTMSERVRFIPNPVGGSAVVLMDLSGFVNASDSLPFISEAREFVATQPPLSVYCLVDVTGSRFNTDVVEAMKGLAAANRPYVVASALIGITGLQRVILESVITFSRRKNLKPLASREAAFDWLAVQKPTS